MTLGATNQGIVAGDMVNTASRLQSRRGAGHGAGRRGDHARGVDRHLLRAGGGADAQGQGAGRSRPGARSPSSRGAADRAAASRPRAAVRRPRRRAAPPQGAVRRDRAGAASRGWSRSSARPASASPGSPGSSRSTSTAWSTTPTGTRAAPRPTARGSATGRWPRWSAAARGSREGDDEATIRRRLGATLDEFVLDPAERRWIEPRAGRAAGHRASCRPRDARSSSPRGAPSSSGWPQQSPVVMVFSDLQWADQGLLDFVENLLALGAQRRRSSSWRSARPELLERRAGLGRAACAA